MGCLPISSAATLRPNRCEMGPEDRGGQEGRVWAEPPGLILRSDREGGGDTRRACAVADAIPYRISSLCRDRPSCFLNLANRYQAVFTTGARRRFMVTSAVTPIRLQARMITDSGTAVSSPAIPT